MRKHLIAALAIGGLLTGACAQKAENVQASYVSPLTYQSYSCPQIQQEASRISSRAAELAGVQNKNASNDAVATGVALVLFWPALFFIKGDKENAAELARMKGELEALEQRSIERGCGIEFRRA